MAGGGGPTSKLPGAILKLPEGATCDDHPDVPAYRRVQGETDSFGYEAFDMCRQCFEAYQKEQEEPTIGTCEICSTPEVELSHQRDPDEGFYGPVYLMCETCRHRLANFY